jgi:hypothetical protein
VEAHISFNQADGQCFSNQGPTASLIKILQAQPIHCVIVLNKEMVRDLPGGGWVEIKIRVHVSSRNIKDQNDIVTRSMQRSSSGLKQL